MSQIAGEKKFYAFIRFLARFPFRLKPDSRPRICPATLKLALKFSAISTGLPSFGIGHKQFQSRVRVRFVVKRQRGRVFRQVFAIAIIGFFFLQSAPNRAAEFSANRRSRAK
jgi:hypothetical protein